MLKSQPVPMAVLLGLLMVFAGTAKAQESSAGPEPTYLPSVVNGMSTLIIRFNKSIPAAYHDSIEAQLADLKYNKDFAYSLTMDDGKESQVLNVLPYFSGLGTPMDPYPGSLGRFQTDGCGNDVPFTAGLAIYSYSTDDVFNFNDLHAGPTADFLSWGEIMDAHRSGWDVMNHEFGRKDGLNLYSARVEDHIDHVWKVTDSLGQPILLSHFVVPAGLSNWLLPGRDSSNSFGPLFFAGESPVFDTYSGGLPWPGPGRSRNKSVANQASPLDGVEFISTHQGEWNIANNAIGASDLVRVPLRRKFRQTGNTNLATWRIELDATAARSVGGEHYWLYEASHGTRNPVAPGQVPWNDFTAFFDYLEATYGKKGSDRVWMASAQEVWEYLHLRERAVVRSRWINTRTLMVRIDTRAADPDNRRYDLSLLLEGLPAFRIVRTRGVEEVQYNPATGLINLKGLRSQELP